MKVGGVFMKCRRTSIIADVFPYELDKNLDIVFEKHLFDIKALAAVKHAQAEGPEQNVEHQNVAAYIDHPFLSHYMDKRKMGEMSN